jgi:hypothetical protein
MPLGFDQFIAVPPPMPALAAAGGPQQQREHQQTAATNRWRQTKELRAHRTIFLEKSRDRSRG